MATTISAAGSSMFMTTLAMRKPSAPGKSRTFTTSSSLATPQFCCYIATLDELTLHKNIFFFTLRLDVNIVLHSLKPHPLPQPSFGVFPLFRNNTKQFCTTFRTFFRVNSGTLRQFFVLTTLKAVFQRASRLCGDEGCCCPCL